MNNIFIGFISTFLVLAFSIEGDLKNYFIMHSIIIVMGGTAAILVFSTPNVVLKSLWLSMKGLLKNEETVFKYKEEIVKISQSKILSERSAHPLISYAQDLWSQGIDPDLFIVLLSQKKKEIEGKTHDAVQAIKNLAKYPPTLGMTGTVMGMISLFSALDENRSNIGSALSIAMTATFFGLVLANVFISPLADRLHVRQVHMHRTLENMYELLLLINQGEPTALIKEELNERAA